MPDTAVLLFVILVSTPVGLMISLVVVFGGLPLYYRLRGVQSGARKAGLRRKLLYVLAGTMIIVAGFCAFEIYRTVSAQNDFWKHRGTSAFWRIPLEEPYELAMRGTMDAGYIGRWQQEESVVENVIGYARSGAMVAGQLQAPDGSDGAWFLFDCSSGTLRTYPAISDFHDACARVGFAIPVAVETVRHAWYVHWGIIEATR